MKEFMGYLKRMDLRAMFITPTENGFIQFFRYAFVGGIATVVDWAVLYILTTMGMYYLISTVFAFFAGLAVNFLLSKLLVFSASEAKVGKVGEFVAYAIIGALGLLITMGIMYVLTDKVGMYFMLSKVIATVIVLAWNYIMRKRLLYK